MYKKELVISKNIGLTIRLDEDLRDTFSMACKSNDLQASLVIRELIKRYVKDNNQLDLFKNENIENDK